MKRIPVTQASYKKIGGAKSPKGVKGTVSSGKVDKGKTRQASYLGLGGFGNTFGRPSMIGAASTFYNNSYMAGGHTGGLGDVPPYIALLNEQNGGILYFPSTLRQKFQFYRFFYRFNPYVKAAVDLNTDLPMSRLQLRMPKMQDRNLSKRIRKFYENMIEQIHLFDKLHSILFENNIIGNCIVFVQFSEEKKRWDKITILPPQQINVANYPMSDVKRIQYRPQMLKSILSKYDLPTDSYQNYKMYVQSLSEQDKSILRDVSFQFVKQLKDNQGTLTFDTDPYSGDGENKIGSFAFHFTMKRHEYQDWGVSPLECILVPLLQQVHYQYTQLSLASRNMTPRDIVTAQGITPQALQDLRDQVDQSMLSPDYKIVTNYNIQWETIGAENRLIDLGRQNQVIQNQLFAGLGVTRQLLTGEGMYSGNRINIQVLNTKYLLVRQMLQKFVEQSLFKPVALENGFYRDDQDGNRQWFYPSIGFTRLTIRDNQEVFDSLFQLYQKGSLPISTILDLFNINSQDVQEQLQRDMFTPKDAVYNEMLRQAYSSLGDKLSENTDLIKQIAQSLTGPAGRKLKYVGQDADEEGEQDYGTMKQDFGSPIEQSTALSSNDQGFEYNGQQGEQQTALVQQKSGEEENTQQESMQKENTEEQSTDDKVKNYLDQVLNKEQGGNDKVDEYINNIVNEKNQESGENDKVNEYINNIVNNNIVNNEQEDNVQKYLNQVLKNQEDKTKQYINKFLGQNQEETQDDQQAGV